MKKNLLFLFMLLAIVALNFTSCKDDDDDTNTGIPGDITITHTIDANVVTYHAEAENAISFSWDLGNGQTPTGADVTGTYSFPGTYTVKCTAAGRDGNTVDSVSVVVDKGDPNIFSDINVFISGYNDQTEESETIWVWAEGDWNMSCGEMTSDADTCYFDPIDESWWHSAGDESASEDVYDDEYQFKLNPAMEYVNNFGDAFVINWMYAAKYFNLSTEIWGDVAYEDYTAPSASWSIEFIESGSLADTIEYTTTIGDTDYDGVFVIHLTNDAYFGYGAAEHDYQICSYINDTLLIRYDNRVPDDIATYFDQTDLDDEGITAGEKEWDYIRLVKKSSK